MKVKTNVYKVLMNIRNIMLDKLSLCMYVYTQVLIEKF